MDAISCLIDDKFAREEGGSDRNGLLADSAGTGVIGLGVGGTGEVQVTTGGAVEGVSSDV